MNCTGCGSDLVKKNGHTRHGKQNYRCLECGKQMTENADSNLITDDTKELIRRTLLEKVSLNGICRIFTVSMPWLLELIDSVIKSLPDDLHAEITCNEEDELELAKLEVDELWSFVGSKKTISGYGSFFIKVAVRYLQCKLVPEIKKQRNSCLQSFLNH